MNDQILIDRLTRALIQPVGGVVGLVDELITVSRQQRIELTWHVDLCQIALTSTNPPAEITVPMSRAVFRAMLARIATLCNASHPDSVSPYGGRGELVCGSDPALTVAVIFENTTDQQSLKLMARSPRVAHQAASA